MVRSPNEVERIRQEMRAEEVERLNEQKWQLQMKRKEWDVFPKPPTLKECWLAHLSMLTGGGRGLSGIRQDFRKKKRVVDKDNVRVYLKNMPKNRYKDVPCLDETRVILKDCDNDYIHANYMCTKRYAEEVTRFICCQAPKKETLIDHWRMIEQEGVEVILMLCDYKLDGKEKCAEYIPTAEKPEMTFGPFTIKLKNTDKVKWECETAAIVNISTLEVHKEGKVLTEAFAKTRNPMGRKYWPPILVHDSAGTGWAAVVVLAKMFLEGIRKSMGMGGYLECLLSDVREHRANAIETEAQYLFLHKVLIDHLAEVIYAKGQSDVGRFKYEYNEFLKTLNGEKKIPEDWR
ncbi:unnamed protein product, partial [Mesorhabditis spiculigera]